jgi:hypothetical protein
MHLALILTASLASTDAVEPTPAPTEVPTEAPTEAPKPAEPEHVGLSDIQLELIGLGIGSVALGTGAGLGAWFDRDGTFGQISAITAGTLGGAMLAASLAALISSWLYPAAPRGETVQGVAEEIVVDTFRFIGIGVGALIGGLIGLAASAVASGFVSATPGTPRGALGLAGGGLMIATSITVLLVAW